MHKLKFISKCDYFRCTQDLFEELKMVWEDRYQRHCGFWHPYEDVEPGVVAAIQLNAKDLENDFRQEIFNRLKIEGKINNAVIENMMSWPWLNFPEGSPIQQCRQC